MSAPLKVRQTFLSVTSPADVFPSINPVHRTRRDLPHWTRDGAIYWVTFRLADSLPQDKVKQWREERFRWCQANPEPWDDQQWQEYNAHFGERLDRWLDAGYGSRALARPGVQDVVRDCLIRFQGDRLRLHAAVIMPNHVHILIEPLGPNKLPALLKGIKGASAREANQIIGGGGKFWLDESYDHIVRSELQYNRFLRYVADNPVKAGLRDHEYWLHQRQGGAGISACPLLQNPQ